LELSDASVFTYTKIEIAKLIVKMGKIFIAPKFAKPY